MPKAVRRVTSPNVIAVAKLVAFLDDGTRTCAELAEETGLNHLTVQRYCAALYRAGIAHICAWEIDGRGAASIRVYKLGRGKDAVSKPRDRVLKSRADRRRKADLAVHHAIAGSSALEAA